MLGLVEHVHRPAHANQRVIAFERGNGFASIQFHGVAHYTVGAHEIAPGTGMLHLNML